MSLDKPVPFFDLKAQYLRIKNEIEPAVLHVLHGTQFILGDEVADFEEQFASYCGISHVVAVNSGTSALHLALLAAGVGPGDEVITTPMTFVATIASILYTGATPVFVDIDPDTGNIDPDKIESAITQRTKLVLPVHLHGLMADMDRILNIANTHGLVVIEDAAQAHGAEFKGRRAGSLGHIGCFSFYPGKNLGACGEGGAVVTNHANFAQTMRMLRDWGQSAKYHHALKGYNYRMDGIQGAILRVKLKHLEEWTEARRERAAVYDDLLGAASMQRPPRPREFRHVYHVYAVRIRNRCAVQEKLTQAGIATSMHYPIPVHLQPAYSDLGYGDGDFPIAERFARETLSLPMFPELRTDQVKRVADTLIGAVHACAA